MILPFKKQFVGLTDDSQSFKNIDINTQLELPVGSHVGAFGVVRKHHIHEGMDLYCSPEESVYAMEEGKVVNIGWFTGVYADSPWWNNTQYILIESKSGVINYGEILVNPYIQIGQKIGVGDYLGHVVQVLRNDKGRPMNMLHLELYKHDVVKPIKEWSLNTERPDILLNPLILF